jgi:hypothetical protein
MMKYEDWQKRPAVQLAFFALRRKISRFRIYQRMVRWFERLGCPVEYFTSEKHNWRTFSYRRYLPKLTKEFLESCEYISLGSAVPPIADREPWQCESKLHISYHSGVSLRPSKLDLTADAELTGNSLAGLKEIAVEIARTLRPFYGYGFTMLWKYSPGAYATTSIIYYDDDKVKEMSALFPVETHNWPNVLCYHDNGHRLFEEGVLRGLYEWNFLSQAHLERRLRRRKIRMRDWIVQEAAGTSLQQLDEDVWWWQIPQELIVPLRQALQGEYILYDYKLFEESCEDFFAFGPGKTEAETACWMHLPEEVRQEVIRRWANCEPEEVKDWFEREVRPRYPGPGKMPQQEPEEVLGGILKALGVEHAEEVEVRQVVGPGQTRTLSDAEVQEILGSETAEVSSGVEAVPEVGPGKESGGSSEEKPGGAEEQLPHRKGRKVSRPSSSEAELGTAKEQGQRSSRRGSRSQGSHRDKKR